MIKSNTLQPPQGSHQLLTMNVTKTLQSSCLSLCLHCHALFCLLRKVGVDVTKTLQSSCPNPPCTFPVMPTLSCHVPISLMITFPQPHILFHHQIVFTTLLHLDGRDLIVSIDYPRICYFHIAIYLIIHVCPFAYYAPLTKILFSNSGYLLYILIDYLYHYEILETTMELTHMYVRNIELYLNQNGN